MFSDGVIFLGMKSTIGNSTDEMIWLKRIEFLRINNKMLNMSNG